MNFNFIQDTSSIKNNFKMAGGTNQFQSATNRSASIFMEAGFAGTASSDFRKFDSQNFDNVLFSKTKLDKPEVKQPTQKTKETGIFNKIADFFSTNQSGGAKGNTPTSSTLINAQAPSGGAKGNAPTSSTLINAQATLQNAQALTSSAQAQALLAYAKKGEEEGNEKVNNKSIDFAAETNKETKKSSDNDKDSNKEKDFSKSSRLELLNAFMQGKPSNPTEAIQMLQNQSLPSDYIQKIKEKFPDNPEIKNLIGNMQAGV